MPTTPSTRACASSATGRGFLYQKVVLVDHIAAAIGSANLDNRSFWLNFEIMVLTADSGFREPGGGDAARGLRASRTKST